MENSASSVLGSWALDLREVPHISSCTLTARPALQNLAGTCSLALARLYMMHFCNFSGWSPSHAFFSKGSSATAGVQHPPSAGSSRAFTGGRAAECAVPLGAGVMAKDAR